MKLWSPRSETNASLLPSGDHTIEPLSPRAKTSWLAGFDPSTGMDQICPPLRNATTSPLGDTRRVPFRQNPGGSAGHRNGPDLDLRLDGTVIRIRRGRVPVGVVIPPTNVNHRLAVARELELAELLAVIRGAVRQASRLPVRRLRHPDVAHAALVEDPRHRGARRRGDHLARVWIAKHLGHGERPIRGGRRGGDRKSVV